MSTSTALTPQQLQALAAEIKETCHPAYDLRFAEDDLRMQQANYTAKVEHRAAVQSIFLEDGLTIILRSPESGREVRVQLGAAAKSLYPPIIDVLDERLLDLEARIVQAHIVVAREAEQASHAPKAEFDYAAAVLHLCLEAPTATVIDEPVPAPPPAPTHPRAVPQRITTRGFGSGSNPSREAAAA